MGLSTVYVIVKQSNGHIRVSSQPMRGSTVEILFPKATGFPEERKGPAAMDTDGGSETVVLVEDEKAILNLASMVLKRNGYNVFAFPPIVPWRKRSGRYWMDSLLLARYVMDIR